MLKFNVKSGMLLTTGFMMVIIITKADKMMDKANKKYKLAGSAKNFWGINRAKILASVVVTLVLGYTVALFEDTKYMLPTFWTFLFVIYIVAPVMGGVFNTVKIKGRKKARIFEVAGKKYKLSKLPNSLMYVFFSFWLGFAFGGIISAFSEYTRAIAPFSILIAFPYLVYHLFCFIGDHPLCIFKTFKYIARFGNVNNSSFADTSNYAGGYGDSFSGTTDNNSTYGSEINRNPAHSYLSSNIYHSSYHS